MNDLQKLFVNIFFTFSLVGFSCGEIIEATVYHDPIHRRVVFLYVDQDTRDFEMERIQFSLIHQASFFVSPDPRPFTLIHEYCFGAPAIPPDHQWCHPLLQAFAGFENGKIKLSPTVPCLGILITNLSMEALWYIDVIRTYGTGPWPLWYAENWNTLISHLQGQSWVNYLRAMGLDLLHITKMYPEGSHKQLVYKNLLQTFERNKTEVLVHLGFYRDLDAKYFLDRWLRESAPDALLPFECSSQKSIEMFKAYLIVKELEEVESTPGDIAIFISNEHQEVFKQNLERIGYVLFARHNHEEINRASDNVFQNLWAHRPSIIVSLAGGSTLP